jgi:toxin CptA
MIINAGAPLAGARIVIKPSMYLALLLIVIHSGGLCCLFFLTMPKLIIAGLIIFISISLYLTLQKFAWLQLPEAIIKMDLIDAKENTWQLLTKNQEKLLGTLRHDTYFSKYLIFLRMNLSPCSIISTVLSPDSISANDWRQLQIILRNFRVK